MVDGAKLIRSPKSGSEWTTNELIAYNITVATQPPWEFFLQNHEPPLEGVDPSLIDSPLDADNVTDATHTYLSYLDLATHAGQEILIDDFARETLRVCGYLERGLVLSTHYSIPLTISGDNRRTAQTDDKTIYNSTQPEPQVIAGAIAAYQYNNEKRQSRELPILDTMTIPCITLVGTRPTFYLVPVTQALSVAVVTGQYPEVPTKVVKCVTFLGHNHRSSEGMETPKYRRLAFQRFVAFRDLAKGFWQTILV
ncbi:uncharacterized protein EDB91DRAFT_1298392 [Suillus paluster]|uniref:uncharacterized protein n=1 Tax=Suillus paluster TaxID=48578 RepID=UPI001B85E967|nr:uncharacterized protein EDB91DRAFT_1298392 [Suillus paluster]KAG1751461.1 hypothetical protein EDB91DRAFT_1298392 [Suillus paluster]